jgi:hypothetical protein
MMVIWIMVLASLSAQKVPNVVRFSCSVLEYEEMLSDLSAVLSMHCVWWQ